MSDEPASEGHPRKSAVQKPEDIEASEMARLCREAVEVVGADAILVVWTKQRRRKTHVSQTAIGNGLTVVGLMRWVAQKVEELDEDKDDDDADDEDDEE
jgi:hypothetical protein